MSSAWRSFRRTVIWGGLGLAAGWLADEYLLVNSDTFFLAGGSDVLLTAAEPRPWSQTLASILVGVAVGAVGLARPWIAAVLAVVGVVGFVSAGHRIMIDGRDHEIRSTYLLVPVIRSDYDPELGIDVEFDLSLDSWFMRLQRRDGGPTVRFFLGLPPWRIDPEPLSRFWDTRPPAIVE